MQQLAPPSLVSDAHDRFLGLLPTIGRVIRRRLRHYSVQDREDLTAEAVAAAYVMFCRLIDEKRSELIYATPLGMYGARQALVGRQVGNRLNINDIGSRYCQRQKGIRVERLDRFDAQRGEWREAIVEDHRTPVPDQAVFRCDFPEWLKPLTRRRRRIAKMLAGGEGTTRTAKRFKLSLGRISQLRRELHDAWQKFHGDPLQPTAASA